MWFYARGIATESPQSRLFSGRGLVVNSPTQLEFTEVGTRQNYVGTKKTASITESRLR